MRRSPFKATIIVSNLPDDFTAEELATLFDEYGLVLGAMIKRSEGAPRGLVNLAPKNAVEAAIRSLDDRVVRSRHIRVRKAPEAAPRPAPRARRRAVPADGGGPAATEHAAPVRPAPRRGFTVERRPLSGHARGS